MRRVAAAVIALAVIAAGSAYFAGFILVRDPEPLPP